MPVPAAQLPFDQRIVTAKKHKLYFIAHAQVIAISTFQCRTGQDGIFPGGKQPLDLFAQTVQPRPSISIGQRMAVAHLFDIWCRMKIVGFKKTPAEFARQQLTDSCFAGARDSENNYDHGVLLFVRAPIFSTANAIRTKSV
jgi:hypothetical protein